ncbi:hypothetical protein LshimejAT787_1401330 [Lyophyllum shimeji]|uniref:F-box domain-containing protein n=1 Tax=Lyophyllum shimeji TaxID=47721 RepID=A0A9P3PYU9_LYOSH|nr:hypothetical protein LshimejAT787_1401330 [Lyophyllum shimeji]
MSSSLSTHTSNSGPLAGYLPNFLLSRFKRSSPCCIHRLPLDIFVDHIFVYLCVEDIMCLRRVNKAFFLLTHEPVIWKRFLSHLNVPLPPLRPTFRYALEATDFEVEQLVSRAVSLEDNWRQPHPRPTSSIVFDTHYHVLDMKLLPGGKYLVASVRDAYRFFIVLYCLDHPKGPHALARFATQMKAFNLQAKYMTFQGKPVIMIAYVRRSFHDGGPANLDPSEYGFRHPIDAPYPFVHELLCVYINLETLEALADPHITPGSVESASIALGEFAKGPFYQAATAIAKYEVNHVSLFEFNGKSFASMVQMPNRVVIIDLSAQTVSTLICENHDEYRDQAHSIRAVRHLPYQREMLVFRTITISPPANEPQAPIRLLQVLEIYEMPSKIGGAELVYPKDAYVLGNQTVANVHISDYGIPTTNGEDYRLQFHYQPSPPISVYLETTAPTGVLHYVVWPSRKANKYGSFTYFYNLEYVCIQTRHNCEPYVAHVVPGALRAIIYTSHMDDRKDAVTLHSLRRYLNPEFQTKNYPVPRVNRSSNVMRKKVPKMPVNVYGTLDTNPAALELYRQNGVAAITWDEGIGRLCIAAGNTPQIEVVDFANVVHPDKRSERWKQAQEYVTHDRSDP